MKKMHIRIYEGHKTHIINRFVRHYECRFVTYSNSLDVNYADYSANADIINTDTLYDALSETLELKRPAMDLDDFEKLQDAVDVTSMLKSAMKQDFIALYEIVENTASLV